MKVFPYSTLAAVVLGMSACGNLGTQARFVAGSTPSFQGRRNARKGRRPLRSSPHSQPGRLVLLAIDPPVVVPVGFVE